MTDLIDHAGHRARTTLVTADDAAEVATVMGAAFADDPVMRWMFAGAPDVAAAIDGFFQIAVPAGRQRGHTYQLASASGVLAGALWLPPDVHDLFVDPTPMGEFLARVGGDAGERLGAVSELMDAHRPATSAFHLLLLGVAPGNQGRGLGGQIMAPVLDRCDHDGLPIYLESSNPRNIGFYERLGFAVMNRFGPDEGVELAGMWREPRSAG